MDDFKRWYSQFPIVQRGFITAVVSLTIIASIIYPGIVEYIYLSREKLMHFQIWRLFTNFFFIGTFGPNIIWDFVYLYFAVTRLESLFNEKQVDEQLWLYISNMLFLSIIALIFDGFFLCNSLLFAFLYIWCKRKPFEEVRFFFGLTFKSGYFPFILMGLHAITGGSIKNDLFGLASGALYIFLKDIYPVSSGNNFLITPKFFTRFVKKYISKEVQQAHNYQNPNEQNAQDANRQNVFGFRAFNGQGVRIG